MSQLWKLAIVGALFFVLGSITVASADKIKQFVISNDNGTQNVGVTEDGRLKVDAGELAVMLPDVQPVQIEGGTSTVEVSNFPPPSPINVSVSTALDPANIVNLIDDELPNGLFCTPETTFTVPDGKLLLITDGVADSIINIWTDVRGIVLMYGDVDDILPFTLTTPLVINSGETMCLQTGGVPSAVFISGQLVDAP